MATGVEFGLLGPLLVGSGRETVAIPPGKQRTVAAALLLRANRAVTLDELAEALWGEDPPPSTRATLRNYIKRLRQALASTGHDRIETLPNGYLIRVDPGELDLSRFEALCYQARLEAREGSWERAADSLREALALWRGEPLADVRSELLARRDVPRLAELRQQAVRARIDADLHLGRHAEVIPELRQLTGAYPLTERLHALLMIALYRDSQQAQALVAYQQCRRVLIAELGTEPGPELRQLERQILAADPALALPATAPAPPPAAAPATAPGPPPPAPPPPAAAVPRQLPASARHFTGRVAELAELTAVLDDEIAAGRQVSLSLISGTAGVGKTALAVQWAQRVAGRFPDGQLYVDLRGYDPGQPMDAGAALAGFLRALGVPGQQIPAETPERAGLYRSLLADRRVLVLLDNAGSAEQARSLLPGTSGSAVVVTSRDALTGLVARDGAVRLDLELLGAHDARELLRALIGSRADAEPEATDDLVTACARLPLALRLAAELAASRPSEPLRALAGELASLQRRLDLLDASGDPRTAVRGVFSWSYQHLAPAAAAAFRLLGPHPGPDFDGHAVAALTGVTPEQATDLLGLLARAHLVQAARPGRHGMHDLLRAYARDLATSHDGADGQRHALTGLFDYYLATAAAAMNTLYPAARRYHRPIPGSATPAPPVGTSEQARAWLDTHLPVLTAVTAVAADHGWPGHATRLTETLFHYLYAAGRYPEAIAIFAASLRAARLAGDHAAEAITLNNASIIDVQQGRYQEATRKLGQALEKFRRAGGRRRDEANALGNLGNIALRLGHSEEAAGYMRQALELFHEVGDSSGEGNVLGGLAGIAYQLGRYHQAVAHLEQAIAIYRQVGDQPGEARGLINLGTIDLRLGRQEQAAGRLRRSLDLFGATGDRSSAAYAQASLGMADLRDGRYQQAARWLRQALDMFVLVGDRTGEAQALTHLGALGLREGRHEEAIAHLRRALALGVETGDKPRETDALNGLGEVLTAAGRAAEALTEHAAALGLAEGTGDSYEQARARHGLAEARYLTGDTAGARRDWQLALDRYAELGTPEADQVRAKLAAIRPA